MTKKPSAASNTQFAISSSLLWNGIRRVFTALLATFMLLPVTSHAVDTLCARVKIEIVQELTLERQAFDVKMKITNGLTTASLDNVAVNVNFKDELGNSVRATSDPSDTTAAFFIRIDTMTGIDGLLRLKDFGLKDTGQRQMLSYQYNYDSITNSKNAG